MNTLFVHCGSKCNYECAHCICESGPTNNTLTLSPSDFPKIKEFLKKENSFKRLHFVGGEPTLFLDLIHGLQNYLLDLNLTYSMTTNGWWWKNVGLVLDKIKLNEVNISFDKFHAKYINTERVITLLSSIRQRNIPVKVFSAISKLTEIIESKEIQQAGFEVIPQSVTIGGRATEKEAFAGYSPNAKRQRCPSFVSQSKQSVIYYSDYGFSPCCGPLFYDGDPEQRKNICSSSLNSSVIAQKMKNLTFEEQFENIGYTLEDTKFRNVCELCTLLYHKEKLRPSLNELDVLQGIGFREFKTLPSIQYLKLAQQKKDVKLILYKKEINRNHSTPKENPFSLTIRQTHSSNLVSQQKEAIAQLVHRYLVSNGKIQTSQKRSADLLEEMKTALRTFEWQILEIKEDEKVLGFTIVRKIALHPYLQKKSTHISFFGIDPELNNKEHRNFIRSTLFQWIETNVEKDEYLTASVDSFNTSSINLFHTKLHFKLFGANYTDKSK